MPRTKTFFSRTYHLGPTLGRLEIVRYRSIEVINRLLPNAVAIQMRCDLEAGHGGTVDLAPLGAYQFYLAPLVSPNGLSVRKIFV